MDSPLPALTAAHKSMQASGGKLYCEACWGMADADAVWPCLISRLAERLEKAEAALRSIVGALDLPKPSLLNQSLSNTARAALSGRRAALVEGEPKA